MPVTQTRTRSPTAPRMTPQTMTTPDGLLIVDKPAGWTSHDVVARCPRLCGAGTVRPRPRGGATLGGASRPDGPRRSRAQHESSHQASDFPGGLWQDVHGDDPS